MEMIQGQLMYVAASFVEGIFLMFLYDFIRAFRMKVKHGRVLRSFFVIALTLGIFLYRTLVKTHVQRAIYGFFRLIFRPYVWIFKKIKGIRKKHLKS